MNLFGKPKSKTQPSEAEEPRTVINTLQLDNEAPSPAQATEMTELTQARHMISNFTSELQESANKQQAAIRRVSSLNALIAKLELDTKMLRRLEGENRELNRSITDLENKLAQKSSWASELDSKLTDLDRRHNETREQLELTKNQLAATKDAESQVGNRAAELDRMVKSLTTRSEAAEDQNRHISHTADKLRESLDHQGSELAQKHRETIELRNSLDELETKFDRKSKQADATMVELKNLRLDYNELKTRHVELTGALENTKYEIRSQKNVMEDTVKRREEENLALKTRIDQLETQVRIKENMSTHLDQEFITLRNELMNERDRNSALESRVRQKSEEVERSGSALAKAKIEFEELNAKFAATLEDFETLRRVNQYQREKLERYASISGVSGGQVMLNADIHAQEEREIEIPEDSENVTRLKPSS